MRRLDWTALLLAVMLVSGPSTAQVTLNPDSIVSPLPSPGPDASASEAPAEAEADTEADADTPAEQEYESHADKSPHQLWVELQALHRELQKNAEEFNYDPLPQLGREFGARLWALLAVTHDDLPIPNQVMAKRTTAVGGEMTGRWTRAAALHWPDSLHDPLLFTNSLMKSIERAYPPELLNPPTAEASDAEDSVGEVGAPGPEAAQASPDKPPTDD